MTARCALLELRNSHGSFKESSLAYLAFSPATMPSSAFRPNRDFLLFGLADCAHKELSTLEENVQD